jgi:hypothetical protein
MTLMRPQAAWHIRCLHDSVSYLVMPSQLEPVLLRQLPVIQKVIRDETWLEAERRGCPVSPQDPAVRENVCQVVLRIGRELRERLSAPEASPVTETVRDR